MFTAKILPPGKSLIDKDLRSLIVDTILSEGGDVTTGNYSGNFRIYRNATLPLPLY